MEKLTLLYGQVCLLIAYSEYYCNYTLVQIKNCGKLH